MVSGTPDPQAARREWASTAQDFLMAVAQAVDNLRGVFQADLDTPSETDEAVASNVVSACSNLNDWLRSEHAPRGFAKAGAELGAAAGVYRNVAVAFNSLADVDGDQREARSNACATLLEQGDHHWRYSSLPWRRSSVMRRGKEGRETATKGTPNSPSNQVKAGVPLTPGLRHRFRVSPCPHHS